MDMNFDNKILRKCALGCILTGLLLFSGSVVKEMYTKGNTPGVLLPAGLVLGICGGLLYELTIRKRERLMRAEAKERQRKRRDL